jgi:hypothetical protein
VPCERPCRGVPDLTRRPDRPTRPLSATYRTVPVGERGRFRLNLGGSPIGDRDNSRYSAEGTQAGGAVSVQPRRPVGTAPRSVDAGVDEEREHEVVEGATHDDPGEEGCDELEPAHRAAGELTARTYPVGGTGSRCGSHQRSVMRKWWRRRAAVSRWPIGPCRRQAHRLVSARWGRLSLDCPAIRVSRARDCLVITRCVPSASSARSYRAPPPTGHAQGQLGAAGGRLERLSPGGHLSPELPPGDRDRRPGLTGPLDVGSGRSVPEIAPTTTCRPGPPAPSVVAQTGTVTVASTRALMFSMWWRICRST